MRLVRQALLEVPVFARMEAAEFEQLAGFWGDYNTVYDEIENILENPQLYAAVVARDGEYDTVAGLVLDRPPGRIVVAALGKAAGTLAAAWLEQYLSALPPAPIEPPVFKFEEAWLDLKDLATLDLVRDRADGPTRIVKEAFAPDNGDPVLPVSCRHRPGLHGLVSDTASGEADPLPLEHD